MPRGDTPTRSGRRAIVIGAGFGGMAAALRLRAKGYDVTLIDRCPRLGGRAQVFERDGFRHDAGPTVLTAPYLFDELFGLFGRRLSDAVTLHTPDPWYRFRFADGSRLDYGPDQARTEAEVARVSPGDLAGFREFQAHAKRVYQVAFERLADRPFHDPSFMARQVPDFLRLRAHRSVWAAASRFMRDDRLRRAFSIQPLLLGGNPFTTTSIYTLIHELERSGGVAFPLGGTGALVDALGALMDEAGIEVRLSTTVERILLESDRATGVALADGTELRADLVVSNCDPLHLYGRMLPSQAATRTARLRTRKAGRSMGLFVLFFGTRRQWPDVAHHTVIFAERHKELLDAIFRDRALTEDVALYLHRPTATDPSFAPPGCDSFYVLCPVPNLQAGIDWSVEGPRLKARILAALERSELPGVGDAICSEFFMTPEDFARDYCSVDGSGFSIAPTFTQSGWFRFHNRAEGVRNLYLVGAGTHPGAGVPGVVLSAKVMDSLVAPVGRAEGALT
jgi:phytoene desaturase